MDSYQSKSRAGCQSCPIVAELSSLTQAGFARAGLCFPLIAASKVDKDVVSNKPRVNSLRQVRSIVGWKNKGG